MKTRKGRKDGIRKKGRNLCTVGRRVERNADALVKPYVSLERESQSDEGKGRRIVANTYAPSMCDHKYMERQRDGKDARGAGTTKRATGAEGQGRTSEEHVCRCRWLRESKTQTGKPYVPNVKFVHSRKRVRPRGRQRCEGMHGGDWNAYVRLGTRIRAITGNRRSVVIANHERALHPRRPLKFSETVPQTANHTARAATTRKLESSIGLSTYLPVRTVHGMFSRLATLLFK